MLTFWKLPNTLRNLRSSCSVSILNCSFEYTVDIFGILHTEIDEFDIDSTKLHFSSQTEMNLFSVSFNNTEESPVEFT